MALGPTSGCTYGGVQQLRVDNDAMISCDVRSDYRGIPSVFMPNARLMRAGKQNAEKSGSRPEPMAAQGNAGHTNCFSRNAAFLGEFSTGCIICQFRRKGR